MKKSISTDEPSNETAPDISSVAYALWQEAGRPPGRYMDFWMKATKIVMEHRQPESEQHQNAAKAK